MRYSTVGIISSVLGAMFATPVSAQEILTFPPKPGAETRI